MTKRTNKRRITPDHYEGQRLKAYLYENEISATQLAERMGKNASTVQNYFYRPRFTDSLRRSLVRALGIRYEQIIGLSIDPNTTTHHQGEQLRLYIEQRGINQTHLAKVLGRRKTTISGYLRSAVLLPASRQQIAAALLTTEQEIFVGVTNSTIDYLPNGTIAMGAINNEAVSARLLVINQLGEWQRLLLELRIVGATKYEINFCQYQIWHLELALSALSLANPFSMTSL